MIKFTPNPECDYKCDYEAIFRDIANGKLEAIPTYRQLILTDLWFILYFVMEIDEANHPFVVDMCYKVETGPQTLTLDVWARGHFKSTILTVGETVQYHLKNPEHCTCIFSYKKGAAEKFLDAVRKTYEGDLMKQCFPDVLYENPEAQSPSWGLEKGITLKRVNKSRPQKTVQASGLVEGMVTGDHFNRLVWDDVETDDIAEQPDQLHKCSQKFDMSQNLGMTTGETLKRVIGTFYSHAGAVVYIRDKKDIHGANLFESRIIPATDNGEISGKPVLLSQKQLDEKMTESSFNSQQLCDPSPTGVSKLDGSMLVDIEKQEIPDGLFKFMIVDPAGDGSDSWGLMIIGVEPEIDEIGASNVYILDALVDNLGETEGTEAAVKMYLRNGIIDQIGVEKVALSTTEVHIANALAKHRRRISVEDKTLTILKPAGRKKIQRIESALAWPLYNGKIHISSEVPSVYRRRIKEEMDQFPYGKHEDGIDALSYIYDMLADFGFKYRVKIKRKSHLSVVRKLSDTGGKGFLRA